MTHISPRNEIEVHNPDPEVELSEYLLFVDTLYENCLDTKVKGYHGVLDEAKSLVPEWVLIKPAVSAVCKVLNIQEHQS